MEGVGKLIELLNEYEPRIASDGEYYDNIWLFRTKMSDKIVRDNAISYIISKSYGFIKWLVDNDKINYEKVDKSWNDKMSFVDFKLDNIMEIRIKVVLMLLAIQDKPIEFLISILK